MNSIRLLPLLLLSVGLCGCEQLMLTPKHSPTPIKRTLAEEDAVELGGTIQVKAPKPVKRTLAQQDATPAPVKRALATEDVETRDEDSFTSRVAIKSKEAGQAAGKAMNPASWKADPNSPAERQRRAAIRKKQKQKQKEPNAFIRWMFPEPKPPRTVGEWLSQDRLDG